MQKLEVVKDSKNFKRKRRKSSVFALYLRFSKVAHFVMKPFNMHMFLKCIGNLKALSLVYFVLL